MGKFGAVNHLGSNMGAPPAFLGTGGQAEAQDRIGTIPVGESHGSQAEAQDRIGVIPVGENKGSQGNNLVPIPPTLKDPVPYGGARSTVRVGEIQDFTAGE